MNDKTLTKERKQDFPQYIQSFNGTESILLENKDIYNSIIIDNKQYNKNRNMKQTIKLRKSELKRMIGETVKRVLKESDELPYLSDQDIHKQYEGFEIDEFTIRPKKFRYGDGYGWEIGFAIHFPNVDHPDFDESRWENVDVWDEEGKRITWDGWYPEDISHQLIAMIRSEIQKHMREMQEFKEQTNQGFANETINRKINRIVSETIRRNLR